MTPWFTALPFLHLIDFSIQEVYQAARFEKESRYYVIRLSKDLLDNWVVTLINGRIKSKLGQIRTIAVTDFNEGFNHFCIMAKIRHQRRYQLKTMACDNALLLHLLPFMVTAEIKKESSVTNNIKNTNFSGYKDKKPDTNSHKLKLEETHQQLGFSF